MNHASGIIDLIKGGLNPGRPRSSHGLTLVPLFGGAPAKDYLLAAEAVAQGLLTITELDEGSVPEVAALNSASVPVLMLDGEHIEGAMQNRVLNTTVLIAAQHKTILPVACVEHGRWHYESAASFVPSDDIAYSRLRSKNAAHAAVSARLEGARHVDQGEVWDDVALKHHERQVVESHTGAMRDAYEASRVEIDEILAAFETPEPGQTGMIAVVGGRCVALDTFDRPETLDKLWARLLRGYAMDGLGTEPAELASPSVDRFLNDAASGEATTHEGVGLGTEVMVTSPSVVGHALAWDEGIVHVALFARSGDDHRSVPGGEIESPARRQRYL